MLRAPGVVRLLVGSALVVGSSTGQDQLPIKSADLRALYRIKAAELGSVGGNPKSKIPDTLYNLADRYGPRLTNSPQFRHAADWAIQQLSDWGMANVHKEKWTVAAGAAPLPGWQCTFFSASMLEPSHQPLIAMPEAWSPATDGSVTGEAVLLDVPQTAEELERMRGKLTGKILLVGGPALPLPLPVAPLIHRFTATELADLSTEPIPMPSPSSVLPGPPESLWPKIEDWLGQEKFLAVFRTDIAAIEEGSPREHYRYESGTIYSPGFNVLSQPHPRPTAIISAEHYNRIARLLARNQPVKVQVEIRTELDETDQRESFNVIAEIPGTGPRKQEVVMVGAHLDSWPYATGATDNAIGCAVAMEAMRILRTLNQPMDRTVRLALWGGEEQGLLGSRAYVKEHFADRSDMQLKPEHEHFSVYFNVDGGSGKIQGIYLRHNEMARPIFEDWFAALKDLTSGTVSIRDIDTEANALSDHMAFDGVGLPAFQFLQDPLDFESRSRHTNMDTSDRVQLADAEQMAVVLASFLYNAATRADKLPRKELPPPQRPRGDAKRAN